MKTNDINSQIIKANYIGRPRAGSKNWQKIRKVALGGSEIAVVMGKSPFKSHYTLWHEKAGLIEPEQMDRVRSLVGLGLEDTITKLFEESKEGLTCHKSGMFQSKEHPFMMAEPDRLITDEEGKLTAILEIKTVNPMMAWQWGRGENADENIPEYYLTQINWYMETLGIEKTYLAALIGFNDLRIYTATRNAELCERMIREAEGFVQSLKDKKVPDIDKTNSTLNTVRELSPEIRQGVEVQVDADLANDFFLANARKKEAEEQLNWAKSMLIDSLNGAEFGYVGGEKTFKLTARKNPKGGFYAPNVSAVRSAR